MENAGFCPQPVYSRTELTGSPDGDEAGVAPIPTEQLIAFVTGDQGRNH